jgi:6-phospho-3-hexuloisomerase
MASLYHQAIDELGQVFDRIDDGQVDRAVEMIAGANKVVVFGGGREGLQIRGLAMRLFHMGRQVSVVGDMTTPPVGDGDILVVTCGPGEISTALALIGVAKQAGAGVLVFTAQPQGRAPRMADNIVVVPAQTMANDQGSDLSVLPMGSLYEGAI